MKKINENNIQTIMFLLVIFGFGIWFFVKDTTEKSALENRPLNDSPTFSIEKLFNAEYFSEFESYYNDQFPMRETFIENKSLFETTLFNKSIVDDVFINKDGYLIEPVEEGEFTPDIIAQRINSFTSSLGNQDVNVFFALAPVKSIVYEDKLPEYYKGRGNELSDSLIALLAKNTNPIDLRESILPHKNEEDMYFYSDHHWKPKAAYYGYVSIIKEMQKVYPEISDPHLLEDFEWEEDSKEFYGSESRRVTKSNTKKVDTVTVASPKFVEEKIDICSRGKCNLTYYNMDFLKSKELYTNRYITYFDGDVPEGIIKNPNETNNKKLLVLKDSYANAMIQFISRSFSETRVLDIRHNKELDIQNYIVENEIDAVLFIHNINSLVNTEEFTNFD